MKLELFQDIFPTLKTALNFKLQWIPQREKFKVKDYSLPEYCNDFCVS